VSAPVAPDPAFLAEHSADVALRDGSTIRVRPVVHEDRERIEAFLEDVSEESIAFRFFGRPSLSWVADWSVDVDYADRVALVAEVGSPPRIVAHAAYVREHALGETASGHRRAEVAFLVADDWQGRGISTILLGHLAGLAAQCGITTFTAEVLPANHRMIDVFRESGFPVEMRAGFDSIAIEFPTSLSEDALERFEERERRAAVAAVRAFLEPNTVAVIGASRKRGTVGGEILRNLLSGGFDGIVYAVNPHAKAVQALPSYRSVLDIPAAVELAVIVVPAEQVVPVARECATAGVRGLLVISSGFAETGPEGARRQHELLEVCRESGMRLIGPNCLGLLNTGVGLNATFAPHPARPGSVGFMSQSGGLGIAIIELAGRLGLGLSSFVSVGNKADLSGNDMLRYWEQDPATAVALLYLESFGNPRKFARIAPRFARRKPLLAVKSGRSSAGARATASHTGALLSASDVTVDALFEQAGVIRADTLHELFSVASLLSSQPVPRGDRVAIVTNAGGPGIMCADACQADGVEVPELSEELQARLAAQLPAGASVRNPVDMIATATAAHYRSTLETLIEAEACDAILTIFAPPLVTEAQDVARAIRAVAETSPPVPIAAVFMTSGGPPDDLAGDGSRVPGFEFPEDAARAVALAARHGRWCARPQAPAAVPAGTDPGRAAAIISRALASGGEWLEPQAVHALLGAYGLPLSPSRFVPDASSAVAAAQEIGAAVALKAVAPGLTHKTDAGGVRLDVDGEDAVRHAVADIETALARTGHALQGLIVQPMARPGVELIVGVVNDHSFGPVLACGAGGTAAELLHDITVRITPISAADAAAMLRSLSTFPLLDGYRGAERCDLAAIEDVLIRVSALVEAHPAIVELDCNPLIARPDGVVIVDARVRVAAAPPSRPLAALART
jgi:acetyl coenzyme A synthetase (ADP forming)-like protein